MPVDSSYDDAIKVWLLRNSEELKKAMHRNHQKLRGLTELEVARKIEGVVFGATPEHWYSEETFGEEEGGAIDFRYNGKDYEMEIDDLPVTQLIRECIEIMDELGKDSPVLYPEDGSKPAEKLHEQGQDTQVHELDLRKITDASAEVIAPRLAANERLHVLLDYVPSTGYLWMPTRMPLGLIPDVYTPEIAAKDDAAKIYGAEKQVTLAFIARTDLSGEEALELTLQRSFQTGSAIRVITIRFEAAN